MTKTVLISGGASGLGRALAMHYAKQNYAICIADIHSERGDQVIKELTDIGAEAFFVSCDITDETAIEELKNTVFSRWQQLDVLINNAGVATAGALEFEDLEQWQWVMNINLLGMVRMCRAFVPNMKKVQSGQIINIASQAGITPISLMASYNASKAAVVSFSETMFIELGSANIKVSVACPSFFATNLDESLRTQQPGMQELVTKVLHRSDIDATQVAAQIYQLSQQGKFMIVTHKLGKRAYWMKRWLPNGYYMNMMKKKLQHFRPKTP